MKAQTLTPQQFNALPKARQRVLVAQDVLARERARQYKIMNGSWCNLYQLKDELPVQLQTAIKEKAVNCHVCAVGAAVASCVVFKNRLRTDALDWNDLDTDHRIGHTVFGAYQIKLMEYCFEDGRGATSYDELTCQDQERANAFISRHPDSKKRFRVIFRNIIANEGKFLP